jgi:hypothetical protein
MLSTQDQGQSIILHVFWRQTRLVDDRVTADNGPKSFMCFEGVPNVHRLYDFLLNHRSLLSLTAAVDVPVLHAPVPFDNASLTTPEVPLI